MDFPNGEITFIIFAWWLLMKQLKNPSMDNLRNGGTQVLILLFFGNKQAKTVTLRILRGYEDFQVDLQDLFTWSLATRDKANLWAECTILTSGCFKYSNWKYH